MEPRLVLNRYQKDPNVVKEEWSYVTRSLPKNTTIGIAVVSDEDSDMNGSIGPCELRLVSNGSSATVPLVLDEIVSEMASISLKNYYAPYSQHLNYEIESIINSEFIGSDKTRFYGRSSNQKKFFIRTAIDLKLFFRVGESVEFELVASDNGSKTKQTSKKKFKIVITPDLASSDDVGVDDYDESSNGEIDDWSELEMSARVLYNFYLDENNQAPIELAHLKPSDFEMLSSSHGVKYEFIVPSLPIKVKVLKDYL